jgi:hypothetical protein
MKANESSFAFIRFGFLAWIAALPVRGAVAQAQPGG